MREELASQPPTLQLQGDLSTVRSYLELRKEISLVVADLTAAEEGKLDRMFIHSSIDVSSHSFCGRRLTSLAVIR